MRANRLTLLSTVFTIVFAAGASGQTYERILVPIAIQGSVLGQHGSEWQARLTLFNDTGIEVSLNTDVFPFGGCGDVPCPKSVPPHETIDLPPFFVDPHRPYPPAVLIYARRELADALYFALRVFDLSRSAENLGTEIPLIRESETLHGHVALLNVPLGQPLYRSRLRVYDIDANAHAVVTARIVPDDVLDTTREFQLNLVGSGTPFPTAPGYTEVDLATAFPGLSCGCRIELDAQTPGLRYWALVSITNNETQQITTVTPQ